MRRRRGLRPIRCGTRQGPCAGSPRRHLRRSTCSQQSVPESRPTTHSRGWSCARSPSRTPADGWEIVEVRAAALNQHDIWSLRGVGVTEESLPVVLGTDAAGVTADGREVVVHAVLGSAGPGEDETLAADFHLFSERGRAGNARAARRRAVTESRTASRRSLSFAEAACLPTAYLTAYRMLFTSRPPAAGPIRARAGSRRRGRDRRRSCSAARPGSRCT